ncbi:uncharacterized protein [Periplaneta americana]|uniref:uncharacterized protein n=1 Tax=Periplaneta americana TaxID=6978 RepID=UPI0037E91155
MAQCGLPLSSTYIDQVISPSGNRTRARTQLRIGRQAPYPTELHAGGLKRRKIEQLKNIFRFPFSNNFDPTTFPVVNLGHACFLNSILSTLSDFLFFLFPGRASSSLENKLRKKWKYLRDQFAVELGKVTRSGDTGDLPASKWPYFQSLLFLKDVVKPRPSPGHLSKVPVSVELATGTSDEPQLQSEDPDAYLDYSESPDETSTPFPPQNEETDEDDVGRNNVGNSTYHPSSVCSESSSNRGRKRKHRITDPFNEPVSSIERQKRFYLEEKLSNNRREVDEDDENLHFFKSLLPHVRKIPNCKLLSFRNCVQELVQQYAYEECVKTQNIPP